MQPHIALAIKYYSTVFLLGLMLSSSNSLGQKIPELANANKIFWYGLDFSVAKMIGSSGFRKPDVIANEYVHPKWNNLIFSQSSKFNINRMCGNKGIISYRDVVIERNENVTSYNLIIDSDYSISNGTLINLIQEYPTAHENSVGLVFVVESFNKTKNRAFVWVVYFNRKTGVIINMNRYIGRPSGTTVLNYWANSIESIIQQAKKDFKYLIPYTYPK